VPLAGHTVAMVTYRVTILIATCLTMTEQFYDSTNVTSTDKEWL